MSPPLPPVTNPLPPHPPLASSLPMEGGCWETNESCGQHRLCDKEAHPPEIGRGWGWVDTMEDTGWRRGEGFWEKRAPPFSSPPTPHAVTDQLHPGYKNPGVYERRGRGRGWVGRPRGWGQDGVFLGREWPPSPK